MLRRREFEDIAETFECKYCQAIGRCLVQEPRYDYEGGGRVYCMACGRTLFTLSKDRAAAKQSRRSKTRGEPTSQEVWDAYSNHCAHCGLSATQLDQLGIGQTKQHVPPIKDLDEAVELIPLCEWCQQDSARQLKKMTALLDRLNRRIESLRALSIDPTGES